MFFTTKWDEGLWVKYYISCRAGIPAGAAAALLDAVVVAWSLFCDSSTGFSRLRLTSSAGDSDEWADEVKVHGEKHWIVKMWDVAQEIP